MSVTASHSSTRKSRYRLKDSLLRLWSRYVYARQGESVQRGDDACRGVVEPTFADYLLTMFERVRKDAAPSLLPKTCHGIGYWWHR